MNRLQTFLQLSAEFGGTKFGPFPGPEIRLGSDPTRNDITLPEALGVLPEHVKILMQTDGSYIIAPTERTAAVHVYRGSGRPKHIATATALAAGDSFALVTAEGPRFFILAEEPPRAEKKKGPTGLAGMAPTREGLWSELKRIGFAMFFRNRIGNMVQRVWMMVKSGTIFSPRYIIAFLFLSTGWIAAIGAMLAGLGSFSFLRSERDAHEDTRSELAECKGEGEDPDLFQLTEKILGDAKWQSSLKADAVLQQAYTERLRAVFQNRREYEWVYQYSRSDFTDLRGQMASSLGDGVARVLSYVAADPGNQPKRDWILRTDSARGGRICARGPARLTFLQAKHLGLATWPDATLQRQSAAEMTEEAKRDEILKATGLTQTDVADLRSRRDEIADMALVAGDQYACLFLEAEDDRADSRNLARAVVPIVGPRADGVPSEGAEFWLTARVARWHTADADLGWDGVRWNNARPPGTALEDLNDPAVAERVVRATADTIARAVAIPCLAALDRNFDEAEAKANLGLPELPRPFQCLYAEYLAEE